VGGERVIVSGMQRVRPSTVVQATLQPPPKPPEFPLRKLLNGARAQTVRPPAAPTRDTPARNGQ
jgi:hypothetical protein